MISDKNIPFDIMKMVDLQMMHDRIVISIKNEKND